MQQPQAALNPAAAVAASLPVIRRIGTDDLRVVLRQGLADFAANRTDVLFLCVIYPIIGLLLAQLAAGQGVLPVLFPLAAGFALVGPIAAIGLNEMSRRREAGDEPSWRATFAVLQSPSLPAIAGFAAILAAIFVVWLLTAQEIYRLTLGDAPPVSATAFVRTIFLTGPGWGLIVLGIGVGFVFALLVLSISLVTFPMLLDRRVPLTTAIGTSVQAMRTNPRTMMVWGLIVAASLFIGSLPALLGLVFVLPILGHATWHLYRRVVT